MGNVVVNTIVRMFRRKAVGMAMKPAKKSMGAKKGKQDGGHKGHPKRAGAKNKKVIEEGTAGSRKGGKSETGRGRVAGTP